MASGRPSDNLTVRSRIEPIGADALRVAAPAKINLNLLVGPRRADGYHPLDSLVAKVSLYDDLELRLRQDGQIRLTCRGLPCGPDEDNLAGRAGRLLAEGRGVCGADITLSKRIRPGRGLGGGSSDAAAVLLGLSRLWRLDISAGDPSSLAAALGSDVPLFLGPPAMRMTGRGERLESVTMHPFIAVLCWPDFACGTAEVYRAFDRQPALPAEQIDLSLPAEPPSRWRGLLVNQLEPAAVLAAPQMAEFLAALRERLAVPVCMTGSGSAAFCLCDDEAEAQSVLARVPNRLRQGCTVVRMNTW